jgi:hypothetical protein
MANTVMMKTCACGLCYSAEGWAALRYVGAMSDGEDGEIELRDCACGSTLAIELPVDRAATLVEVVW